MQVLLGHRELAREPLHRPLQLLRHRRLYPLRLSQELAVSKDVEQGDIADNYALLAQFRV